MNDILPGSAPETDDTPTAADETETQPKLETPTPAAVEHKRLAAVFGAQDPYRALLQSMGELVWVLDARGETVFVSDKIVDLLGYAPDEMIGRSLFDLLDAAGDFEAAAYLEQEEAFDFQLPRRDGGHVWVKVSARPLLDEKGELSGVVAVLSDISAHKKLQHALQQSRERYRRVIDSQQDLIVRYTPELVITFVNDAACRFMNRSRRELLGSSALEFIPPERHASMLAGVQHILESGQPLTVETPLIGPGGQLHWFLWDHRALITDTVEIQSVAHDLTERREMEQRLRESEQRLRLVTENMPGSAVLMFDHELRFMLAAGPALETFGIAPQQVEGLTVDELAPEDPQMHLLAKDICLRTLAGQFVEQEASFGNYHLAVRTRPIHNDAGQVTAGLIIVHDVTGLKETQDALRRSEFLYRTMANHLPGMAVFIYDHDLRYLLAEGSMTQQYPEFHRSKIEGHTLWEVLPEEVAQEVEPYYRRGLAGEVVEFEGQTGQMLYEAHIVPVVGPDGRVQMAVLMVRDVTESRAASEQAMALVMERERVGILSRFITAASHEFRTPLSVISSSAYLLAQLTDPEKRQRHSTQIETQVQEITALVDALVTMTRLDGKHEFARIPLNLNRLVGETLGSLDNELKERGHELVLELDPDLPQVPGEAGELYLALRQILHNAIRYTEPGGMITLRSYAQGKKAMLEVQDSGIGIPPEAMTRIFERFYRQDAAHGTRGFGLGLPIALKIVEGHGGKISVTSMPGNGALFTITLPLK